MVDYRDPNLDAVFSSLGDATRRAILSRLTSGAVSISELAAPYEISLTAVSKHVRVLESAGLVTKEKEGRTFYVRLNPEPLRSAAEWIAHYRRFWEESLDSLGDFLTKPKTDRGEE